MGCERQLEVWELEEVWIDLSNKLPLRGRGWNARSKDTANKVEFARNWQGM